MHSLIDLLPRGVYHARWLLNGTLPLFSVSSAGEKVGQMFAATRDEIPALMALLRHQLDQVDPAPPSSRPGSHSPPAPASPRLRLIP